MTPILHYYNLHPDVVAFSTTRQGGCSTGCYAGFNINRYCGDDEAHIRRNRESLCRLLGIGDDRLVMPHQTHETRVACINEQFLSLSTEKRLAALEGYDALMTDQPDLCIGVSTADCIPVLLYDPRHHAACAVHGGWRGTVKRIVEKAVAAMTDSYGTRPCDLLAQIGPGISIDSFEVGEEVYDAFRAEGFEMNIISKLYSVSTAPSQSPRGGKGLRMALPLGGKATGRRRNVGNDGEGSWHIDLPECNRRQLMACGVPPDRIMLSNICTYKDCERFFSARRLGIHSGRIFTGIIMGR